MIYTYTDETKNSKTNNCFFNYKLKIIYVHQWNVEPAVKKIKTTKNR